VDQREASALADELKALIYARTGLAPQALACPREKSDMTPCVARDGHLVVVFAAGERPICVGCEADLLTLVERERSLKGVPWP
jgi:hypothetical protein